MPEPPGVTSGCDLPLLTTTSSRVVHSPLSQRIHRLTRSQPAAEGTSLRSELPLPHLLSDRPQHVLSDVGHVSILQTFLPSETVHPRRVQPDKLLPRQPDPQADVLLSVIHSYSEYRTDPVQFNEQILFARISAAG